jgi:hypothetical protein
MQIKQFFCRNFLQHQPIAMIILSDAIAPSRQAVEIKRLIINLTIYGAEIALRRWLANFTCQDRHGGCDTPVPIKNFVQIW